MSEQKSVLTTEKIAALLQARYQISVTEVQKLERGSANCFRVSGTKGVYFLKEYQSRFCGDGLCREAGLVGYLKAHGYPTAGIIPAADGALYFVCEGRFLFLQEYIDGKTYADSLSPPLLAEAADLLGLLHRILRGYVLPSGMDRKWVDAFSPEKSAAQYGELFAAASAAAAGSLSGRICADLMYKKRLVYDVCDYGRYFNGITYCATHGDYSSIQFICDGGHIKAVIDFSSAQTLPVIWEIMRSYVQSSDVCLNGADFDTEGLCSYVGRYMQYAPLTAADLAAMPYVYLYQLARSKYGYREYLITETENKDDLIRFAFRRTDICREIDRKKAEISARLLKLL